MDAATFRHRAMLAGTAAAACGLLAVLCLAFMRATRGAVELWLVDALLAGWMLRSRRRVAPTLAAAGFVAVLPAYLAFGASWPVALVLAATGVADALATMLLLRRTGIDPRRPLDERAFAVGTALAVLGAPAASAALAAGLLVLLQGGDGAGLFLRGWVRNSFGMLTVLPVAFSLHRVAIRRLFEPGRRAELSGWLLLELMTIGASFWIFPRFVIVELPLLAIAFRFGLLPASIANLLGALVLVVLGGLGEAGLLGPLHTAPVGNLGWAVYSAAMLIGPLMVSVSVERLRERAHELARRAEHQRVTLNAIGDAMVACDRQLRITEFNPEAERIAGIPRASAIGHHVEDVIHFTNIANGRPLFSPLRLAIDSNRPASFECEAMLERDGAPSVPVEDSASPIIGPDGSVIGGIMVFRDVTERRLLARQMAHLAQHDALTGLPNRMLLRDRLEQEIRGIPRGHAGCVMFLDLDRFKHINDTLGHAAGDEVLRGVGTRLQAVMRESDTLSRQGGDEFVLLCPELIDGAEIRELARRLAAAVEQPQQVSHRMLSIGTSIGITRYPQDGSTAEELLRQADVALYRAKKSGRGRIALYMPEFDRSVVQAAELERELRRALPANEFFLQYQPQHDMGSGFITGAEALVRWRRPDGRIALPGEFLALAEETGVVVAIDRWVLQQACDECSRWAADGLAGARVSVNVSLAHFDAAQLVADVREAIARSGLAPNRLEIEFTETHLLREVEQTVTAIAGLRELGVAVAIDDFGTGYSNLSQLSAHHFDVLKIDRSLVSRLPGDRRIVAVVQAMIAMAEALGCGLVAEGVETLHQADWLRGHGCAVAQGFLYDPPLDAPELRGRMGAASTAPAPQY